MKKIFFLITIIFTIFLSINTHAQNSDKDIAVLIDGNKVEFDVNPIIKDGRTLVPFRAIAESLNIEVVWDDLTKTITAGNDKVTVKLQINNKSAYISEGLTQLEVEPIIIGGRTLIPLRFFGEAFGCQVDWDGTNRIVKIISPKKAMTIVGYYALGDVNTSSWTNLFKTPYPETSEGNTNNVSELALGWYSIDNKGNLIKDSNTGWRRPNGWEDILKSAKQYNLRTEMMVYLSDGRLELTSLLNNEDAYNKAIEDIVNEAKTYGGVNLDFEGLGFSDKGEALILVRNSFVKFVNTLSAKLRENNLTLTLTLHPLNSAYQGYDYKELGKYADKIIIMAYDYGTKPEPDSMVIEAVQMARENVPEQKLILGISAPSETGESIISKIGIAKRYNLDGIALWRLGLITNEMWDSINMSLQAKK